MSHLSKACIIAVNIISIILSLPAAHAHPIAGNEDARFKVFPNFVECSLHGPIADIAGNDISPSDMKGEDISEESRAKILDWLKSRFIVKPDGKEIPPKLIAAYHYPARTQDQETYELVLRWNTEKQAKHLDITARFDPKTLISVGGGSYVLTASAPSATFETRANLFRTILDFCWMGMDHLFTGFDHLLFIATIIFACMHLVSVVKMLTAFTIGHACTLIMTSLGWFQVPGYLADVGVAATIIFVAVQNILSREEIKHRWMIILAFGLIHGMGFAHSLSELLPKEGLILCLLSFNMGIELAQIIVATAMFPLLMRIKWKKEVLNGERGAREFRMLLNYGSGFTAVMGAYWLITRLFGMG
jgi:hypothetical protein